MIDMKQLKENISNKLNPASETDSSSAPVKEVITKKPSNTVSQPMAIGATIHIKGDVTGDEDLIIHGHVEGKIDLKDYNVIIGQKGKVQANIHAKQIVVEGKLDGDLKGEEKVIIRHTGNVLGNVVSPRVTLEDGAMFKGSIEMEPNQANKQDKSTTDTFSSNSVKSNLI
jgi:cytoskeletal protein CcmA (bactofilin family)